MIDGVPAESVIRVLKAYKVAVTLADPKTSKYTLEKDEFFEDVVLTGTIGKRYLQYLKRKLNIQVSHFWHPEEAEKTK
jgi:predicted glycosyltransferase involved in capsule biosynthesis